jgi:SAM-dependent methyltransferase
MQEFWDRRADEDAFYFIDNRLSYRRPEMDRFWAEGERDLNALLSQVDLTISPTDRVLEIGCGVGRLTRVLSERAASVQALDVSERMLELGKELNPSLENVTWIRGDGMTLGGIASGSIDMCVSHVVFQHIPDPNITLGYVREIGRVLRPGGYAAFQISNDPRLHRRASLLKRAQRGVLTLLGRAPHGQNDARWLGSAIALDELKVAVADGSMGIERIVGEGTQFCFVRTRRLAASR